MDSCTADCLILILAALLMVVYVPLRRTDLTHRPPVLSLAAPTPNSINNNSSTTPSERGHDQQLFAQFVLKYNLSHQLSSDSAGYQAAFAAFQESLRRAARLNAAAAAAAASGTGGAAGGAVYGPTRFSALTRRQFAARYLTRRRPATTSSSATAAAALRGRHPLLASSSLLLQPLPPVVDWRQRGAVTKVNDQGQCGACWAFSDVETLESMYAISSGNLTRLSAQELIDCSLASAGCLGGDICSTLDWMTRHPVLPASLYPLNLHDNRCALRSVGLEEDVGVRVRDYGCVSMTGSERLLLQLLAHHGPLAAAVDASSWQDYQGGVIRYNCGAAVNHAVQIVGYDMAAAVPYYLVRNSWGAHFGLDGYLKIAIGDNVCGIAVEVGYLDV